MHDPREPQDTCTERMCYSGSWILDQRTKGYILDLDLDLVGGWVLMVEKVKIKTVEEGYVVLRVLCVE